MTADSSGGTQLAEVVVAVRHMLMIADRGQGALGKAASLLAPQDCKDSVVQGLEDTSVFNCSVPDLLRNMRVEFYGTAERNTTSRWGYCGSCGFVPDNSRQSCMAAGVPASPSCIHPNTLTIAAWQTTRDSQAAAV
jgi:hypothetical protein